MQTHNTQTTADLVGIIAKQSLINDRINKEEGIDTAMSSLSLEMFYSLFGQAILRALLATGSNKQGTE